MAKWRPTRAQFYTLGLPASVCTLASRVVASADSATDTLVLAGHGFGGGELLRFEAAAQDAVLPAPLSASLLYEVESPPPGSDLFRVRSGGALVNLTTAGTGPFRVIEDFGPKLDLILEAEARWCDDHAIPYAPPDDALDGWPPFSLVKCACELAALKVSRVLRVSAPGYSADDLKAQADGAQAFLDKLRAGKPLAVQPVDATPTTPEVGAKVYVRRKGHGFRRDEL